MVFYIKYLTFIMKSGICLPTIAVNGQVAGLWNIKKGRPTVEFFTPQPKRIKDDVFNLIVLNKLEKSVKILADGRHI